MSNLVLITSIINTPNTPLSYGIRSIFTCEQRFEQTKLTIKSIKEKIPDCQILIVECSEFTEEQENYFLENSNYLLNLFNNIDIRQKIHSSSKSLCEGTMTQHALEFILEQNIKFDNLIKISGRYYLSENFCYDNFNNDSIVIKYIHNNINNVFTALYKLPYSCILKFKEFLINNINNMMNCIGYEVLFAEFIKQNNENIRNYQIIGLAGYLSVSNDFYDG